VYWRIFLNLNVLPPSWWSLNVVQVDAEVFGRKDCVCYIEKLEGFLSHRKCLRVPRMALFIAKSGRCAAGQMWLINLQWHGCSC
jgi:hypothetical protein